jgi:tetratricopeptide (TPR) repeat protein
MPANFRQRLTLAAILAMAALFTPAVTGADDDNSWAGRKIMTKDAGIRIGHSVSLLRGYVQRQVYDAELTDLTYTVLKEQDGWLSVRHRGAQGWFPKERAVLLDDALSYFDDRVRANGQDAFALACRGRAWKERREYEKALTDLNEAIRLDPERPAYFSNRGMVYDRLGEYDRAIGDYDQALRRDPTDSLTYNHRGLAYRAKKDDDRAISDYGQAIRLDAQLSDAYFNRGNVYKAKRDFGPAIRDYSEAIRLEPNWVDPYFNRANARRANKEYEQAARDYSEVVRLDREDADACSNLAWLLATCPDAKVRDGKKAVEYATKACDLTSWKASYFLSTLAAACAENGEFDQAIKWQKRALESSQYERNEGKSARQRLALFEDRRPYREE